MMMMTTIYIQFIALFRFTYFPSFININLSEKKKEERNTNTNALNTLAWKTMIIYELIAFKKKLIPELDLFILNYYLARFVYLIQIKILYNLLYSS